MDRIGTGVLVGQFAPGSAEWHAARAARLGGSEIAAVVGLSPWESRFSLWMRKAGAIGHQVENPEMEWGTRLEDPVADKFAEQHPDSYVMRVGTYVHDDRDYQLANPDRMLWTPAKHWEYGPPSALLECKTALYGYEWGPDGSDQIPVYYRAQVLWYLDTFGLDLAHVAVLIGGHDYREYVIPASAEDQAFLRKAGREFLDSVAADQPPDIDAHSATYQAIQELHPQIEPRTVELSPETARSYVKARAWLADAKSAEQLCRSKVAAEMGMAQTARYLGRRIASRQARADSPFPFVVAARNLPDQLDPREEG